MTMTQTSTAHQQPNNGLKSEAQTAHSAAPERLTLQSRRKSSVRNSLIHKKFSTLQSTADHFRSDDDLAFYGPYAHIRKNLDYSYHSHYRKERQWLQDSIVDDLLGTVNDTNVCTTPAEPWLIYTVGAPGAGKRYTLLELVKKQQLPLLSYVAVDVDEIRRKLPEFSSYLKECPDRVNDLTRREAGYIMEILTTFALQSGKNVVLDGSLKDTSWYDRFFKDLRQDYSNLKIALIHITAPYETILERCDELATQTGRSLSEDKIRSVLDRIPESVDKLKRKVDFYCTLSNSDKIRMETPGISWQSFRHTFMQRCAWMPGDDWTKEKLEKETAKARLAIPSLMRRRQVKNFSSRISTEENNRSTIADFYGSFSHIRATLDYTYHAHYTRKRQFLQDSIIAEFLDGAVITDRNGAVCTTPTEPWIVFTAGAMGAGKGYTMNKLVEKGRFPLLAFVHVDPDEIRRYLPEYHIYVNESPELAGELTRKEAGFIAEILTLAGMQAGKNVLVDGSLRDSDWYKAYFARLKQEYPAYRQAIIHVKAPREAVFQRAADRAKVTGRVVPRKTLEMALDQVPRSVKILGPLVDYFCELNNAPSAPDIELLTSEETWESFERQWLQTCAWIPSRRKFLRGSRTIDKKLTITSSSTTA